MNLLLIRHLPTKLNETQILQGRSDEGISRQTVEIGAIDKNRSIISKLNPEKVYSSPLLRACETARMYGYNDYVIDERLIEFDFGEYEGRHRDYLTRNHGSVWFDRFTQITLGEGYLNFSNRVDSFIESIAGKYETVLIFSHGVVVRYLISKMILINPDYTNLIAVKNNQMQLISFP